MCYTDLIRVEARVYECRISRAVVTCKQLKRVWPKSIEGVDVSRAVLHRVVAGVMRESLLEPELIDDTVAAILDIKEAYARITGERNVERKVH